jgi:hypothetical protein
MSLESMMPFITVISVVFEMALENVVSMMDCDFCIVHDVFDASKFLLLSE